MPRQLVRTAEHDRNRSLGWLAIAWMEYFTVHGPGDVQGQPVVLTDEYAGFVVDVYAVDGRGRLLYDSAFLSRPKGTDKSGQGGRFGLFEALGPARFAGWARGGEVYEDPWGLGFRYVYSPGEPMGRPVVSPFLRILATEEEQTGNVYNTIYFNLTEGLLSDVPGIDPGMTRVFLPGGGEIRPSTAAASSKDGGLETWSCFDESHLYNTPPLRQMYKTVTRNLRKRKDGAGTWFLETTTMFAPGEESVAERTYELAEAIREGQERGEPVRRERLLCDHRWGECEDPSDEDQLRAALLEAYGDAIAWNDLDGLVDEFYDTRTEIGDSRRYFLNAETSHENDWIARKDWVERADATKSIADGEMVALGFDGSVREDSTALVVCRISDGHVELVDCWEKPADWPDEGPKAKAWQVDRAAVDATVSAAFERWQVAAFYADPAHWQDYLDRWTQEFGGRVLVRAVAGRPLEWWTNRPKAMVAALERFEDAVRHGGMSHDGGSTLSRHVLNAKRRFSRVGVQISKEHPSSHRKIDAAMAATLAYEARADCVAAGVDQMLDFVPVRVY